MTFYPSIFRQLFSLYVDFFRTQICQQHLHLPAANHTFLRSNVVAHVDGDALVLAGADQVIRLPHNGALTAAAADGARSSRIGINHHVRAGFYRRGTAGLVHEHERFGNITACSGFQQRQVDVLCGENAALGTAIGRAAAFRDQL